MIKAIVFDMDGLMIDTECLYQIFWRKALAFYGYTATDELLLSLRSLSRDLAAKLLRQTFGEELNYEQVRLKRVELMNAYIDEHGIKKKKGLDEILAYGKKHHLKMAVATATEISRTKLYLEQLNIFEYFDAIVCGPMVPHGKPAPDIYEKAACELGVPTQECLALEDSPNGVLAGARAGCKVIMVPEDEQSADEVREYLSYVAKDLNDVVAYIKVNNI